MTRLSMITKLLGEYVETYNNYKETQLDSGRKAVGCMLHNKPWKSTPGLDMAVELNDSVMFSKLRTGLSFNGTVDGLSLTIYTHPDSNNHEPNIPRDLVLSMIDKTNPEASDKAHQMFNATRIASMIDARERDFKNSGEFIGIDFKKENIAFWTATESLPSIEIKLRHARNALVSEFNRMKSETGFEMKDDMSLHYGGTNITDPFNTGKQDFSFNDAESERIFGRSLTSYASIRTMLREKDPVGYDAAKEAYEMIARTSVISDSLEDIIDFNNDEIKKHYLNDFEL